MADLIDRQKAIDALIDALAWTWSGMWSEKAAIDAIKNLPSADPEPHYCRECKWSWCHINVGKHGETETYWRCLNWDGGTDEEGFCHEWERRDDGNSDLDHSGL